MIDRSYLVCLLWIAGFGLAPVLSAQTPWSTGVTPALLQAVMPEADFFTDKQGEPPVYMAYHTQSNSGERALLGYVFLTADVPPAEKGYSAPIDMLIGLDIRGRLTGMKVLNYVESFRYSRGDFLTENGFQEQFRGKSIRDTFRLRQDLDGVSNATISSWAITRNVRDAARRVAQAYLDYQPEISNKDIWAANAASQLAPLSWEDMLGQGLLAQKNVTTPSGSAFTLTIGYMGKRELGELLVGKNDYTKAERDASIRFDTQEMVMFAISGEDTTAFRQERFGLQQGDGPAQSLHPRLIVSAGSATQGLIAGKADYAGAIVMSEVKFDPTQPFNIIYRAVGQPEPVVIPYQLSGVALLLAKGEAIASLEELEQERLIAAPWYVQIGSGFFSPEKAWQDTDWVAVIALVALLVMVMTAFLRKNSRLRWVTLALTLIYLGFYNGGFLSVSQITGLINRGPDAIVGNLPLLILVLFTLITTLLWGRVFCASLCPFGALQDFITQWRPKRWCIQLPTVVHDWSLWIKYGFLALIVTVAIASSSVSIFQYFEPFGTLFYFSHSLLLWSILIVILAGCIVVDRFYCRYVCPLGAALALLSLISPWRIQRVSQCNICKVCEHACPTGAIRGPDIDFKECVRCDICEIKLIERAGTCRHSVEEVIRRSKDVEAVKLIKVGSQPRN